MCKEIHWCRKKKFTSSIIATAKIMIHFHLSVSNQEKNTHKQAIQATHGFINQWYDGIMYMYMYSLFFFARFFVTSTEKCLAFTSRRNAKSMLYTVHKFLSCLLLIWRFSFLMNHQFHSICKDGRQFFLWFDFAFNIPSIVNVCCVHCRPSSAWLMKIYPPTDIIFNDIYLQVKK